MHESLFVLELQHKARLEVLQEILEGRFGPLSIDLRKQIEAVTDANKVEQLLRESGRVKSPEDLPV